MNALVDMKASLLEGYQKTHQKCPVHFLESRMSESDHLSSELEYYYSHRHAFIEDLALEMAANLKINNYTNFFDDAVTFANSTRCQESLVNYFSSGPYAISLSKDIHYHHTFHIMVETNRLAAEFLSMPPEMAAYLQTYDSNNLPDLTGFFEATKRAYCASAHYAKSQLPNYNFLKTYIPHYFRNTDHETTNTDNTQNALSIIKQNLLQAYSKRFEKKWVYATTRESEIGKSHAKHRDAFIQDLALDMAAYLQTNDSNNLYKDSITFVQTEACQDMLTNYFSSGPFATSQVAQGYDRNYTLFVLQDTVNLAADFLKIPNTVQAPDYNNFYQHTKRAYLQSTHFRDSQLADDNPYKTVVPYDFREQAIELVFNSSSENLFEQGAHKEDTFLNTSNKKSSMFTNEHSMETEPSCCTIC